MKKEQVKKEETKDRLSTSRQAMPAQIGNFQAETGTQGSSRARFRDAVKYKDTVFRALFKDRRHLLELYNAVAGKDYQDPDLLEIVTLDNAIYMGIKNDLAFLIGYDLHLYEHQSTVNLNMPFRMLLYVVEEYDRLTAGENFFGTKLIKLPTPHFVVFYNGTAAQPERRILKLSDAFRVPEENPELELKVLFLNINEGFNEGIKEQCRTLKEYMEYVEKVRKYACSMSMEEAVSQSIEECIREDILRDFLLANKAEVEKMWLYEFDEEAYDRDIRDTAFEEGKLMGKAEGIATGKAEAVIELLSELGSLPEEPKTKILAQTDCEVLSRWHKAAAKAESLEEWMKMIEIHQS